LRSLAEGVTVPRGFSRRQEDVESGLKRFPMFIDIMSRQSQASRMLAYMVQVTVNPNP
jgi:hypothetical protein